MSASALSPVGTDLRRLGTLAPGIVRGGLAVGAVGLGGAILIAGVQGDWERFFRAYLVAFMFVVTIGLGALFFVIVQHATRAGWSVVLRRIAEAMIANFAWIWVLFIPIVIALFRGDLYEHWTHSAADDHVLAHKAGYLDIAFWLVRAAVYFTVWGALGLFYYRTSVAQDRTGDFELTRRMAWAAPISALLFALTLTFAAIDWIKTLEPHWFSTIFGVYAFAGSCCAFFSFQIIAFWFLQRRGRLVSEVTTEHYQDMGKLLFAFGVVFWSYIAFSQFMLIWYANLPEETTWYLARSSGGWKYVSGLLIVGHFALPFLLLISRHAKRTKNFLVVMAVWMLAIHYVDLYWLVMPLYPAEAVASVSSLEELREVLAADKVDLGFAPSPIDLACALGLAGLLVAGTARSLRSCSLIPAQDPRLGESLAFENS